MKLSDLVVRWRYMIGAVFAVSVLLGGGLFWYSHGSGVLVEPVDFRDASEVSVVLTEHGFEPQELRVRAGTKVTFTTTRTKSFWPASNAHPSHNIYPEFDPRGPIEPGESWTFVPDKPGVWGFHDHIRSYYTGTLYVE